MDNFKKTYSELRDLRRRYDYFSLDNHYKVIQIGNGESGYCSYSQLRTLPMLKWKDIGFISETPITRPFFGQFFYSFGFFERLDFEIPLIRKYKEDNFYFENIIHIDPKNKEIFLLGNKCFTYDYLLLNCGLSIDYKELGGIREKLDLRDNYFYCIDDFDTMEKMKEDFENYYNGMPFNIIVKKSSDRVYNVLEFAFITKNKFKKSKVNIFFEDSLIVDDEGLNQQLLEELQYSKIDVSFDNKFSVKDDNGVAMLVINDETELRSEFVLFAFDKKIPEFLDSSVFGPDSFNKEILQHKEYEEIFCSGSFINRNSTLGCKYEQSKVAISNLHAYIKTTWTDKPQRYKTVNENKSISLVKDFKTVKLFNSANKANENGFIRSRLRGWRYFNIDLFKFMYVLPYGFKIRKLFK